MEANPDYEIKDERLIVANRNNSKISDMGWIAANPNNRKIIETRWSASVLDPILSEIGGFSGENNPMLCENISRIIRWYKGRCAFEMRKTDKKFHWHSRFHDHIIRNQESFERIQNYIEENPLKWKEKAFYQKWNYKKTN